MKEHKDSVLFVLIQLFVIMKLVPVGQLRALLTGKSWKSSISPMRRLFFYPHYQLNLEINNMDGDSWVWNLETV